MEGLNTVIAVLPDHRAAEAAIKKLAQAGFDLKSLSVIGHGYPAQEHVIGFYNVADRVTFWGSRGAFWGGLWNLFFSGVFVAAPETGPVVVLGFLASTTISILEGGLIVGGLGAVGSALHGIGIPKDSVVAYEAEVAADSFLVMVNGAQKAIEYTQRILAATNARRVDVYSGTRSPEPGDGFITVRA